MKRLTREQRRKLKSGGDQSKASKEEKGVASNAEVTGTPEREGIAGGDHGKDEDKGINLETTRRVGKASAVKMQENIEKAEGWYPGKRELTKQEEAQRERDMKVSHGSGVIPHRLEEELDAQRRANWIPPAEVEKMPMWKPVLQPVVDAVIGDSVKEVAAFMGTVSKEERAKVVEKLIIKVLKRLPKHDVDLIEKRIWGTLFDLQREQGVSNMDLIGKVIK